MTVRVRVRNFQSIKDATLDIEGFTVVTGPNNSGKTAFMRAVRGAVQNTRGKSFIRRGTTETTVDLAFDDGHTLTWKKGTKAKHKPTYIVDGGEPIYPGQGVPDEVRALGIRPIKAAGRDIWPQIAAQFHQVFLIDEPGSVLAEAVADVERVGQLNVALSSSKSDHTKATSTLQVRLGDEKKAIEELAGYGGLDAVVAEVEAVEAALARAGKISRAAEGLGTLQYRLREAEALVESLAPIEEIEPVSAESVQEPGDILEERDALSALRSSLEAATASEAHWAPVDGLSVPPVEVMSALRESLDDLAEHRRLSVRYETAKATAKKWGAAEGVSLDADEAAVSKVLSALGVVVALSQRRDAALEQCATMESRVGDAETEADQAEVDFLAFLEELGECPVCGGSTEAHEC